MLVDDLSWSARYGAGGTATQTVNVTITPVNDAPVVAAATQAVTTNEDTAVTGTVVATDVDGDSLTYAAAGAAKGVVTFTGNAFTYTPNPLPTPYAGQVIRGEPAKWAHHDPRPCIIPPDYSKGFTSIFAIQQQEPAATM